MILEDLAKIKSIKKEIYEAIKSKGVEFSASDLFEVYPSQVDKIETAGPSVEKPFFTFFKVPPEPKSFVFGGGVSAEMGGIYFGNYVKDFEGITATPIKIGSDVWGYTGLSNIGSTYLSSKPVDMPQFTFIKAQPTCTDKVFGPEENSSADIQVI